MRIHIRGFTTPARLWPRPSALPTCMPRKPPHSHLTARPTATFPLACCGVQILNSPLTFPPLPEARRNARKARPWPSLRRLVCLFVCLFLPPRGRPALGPPCGGLFVRLFVCLFVCLFLPPRGRPALGPPCGCLFVCLFVCLLLPPRGKPGFRVAVRPAACRCRTEHCGVVCLFRAGGRPQP
jgi:hypothetical protein